MERRWIETGLWALESAAGNALWLSGMAGGAFALALAGERVLILAIG